MKTTTETPENPASVVDSTDLVDAGDYYSIHIKRSPKAWPYHLCNVFAKSKADAMRLARDTFGKLPKWTSASRIGKEGYYNHLRSAFR